SSRATLTSAVLGSACDSRGTKVMVVALSSSPASRAAPHDRQKFDPSGLRWPHWLQNTARGYPAKRQAQVERQTARTANTELAAVAYRGGMPLQRERGVTRW